MAGEYPIGRLAAGAAACHNSGIVRPLALVIIGLLVATGTSKAEPPPVPTGDPAVDGAWSHPELSSYPPPRHRYALVYDSIHHRVILYGGLGADGDRTYDDVWALDLDDPKRWEQLPVRPADDVGFATLVLPRADVLAVYDDRRDRLWIWGGVNHTGAILGDPCYLQFTPVEGELAAWHSAVPELEPGTGQRPAPRRAAAFAWDETGRRIIFHGGTTAGSAAGGTWALALEDPPGWQSFGAPSPFPGGAVRANLHVDPITDRLILHGALDPEGFWSPEIWTLPLDNTGSWTQARQSGESALVNVPVTSVIDPRDRRLIAMASGATEVLGHPPATVGVWAWDIATGAWSELHPSGDAGPPDGVSLLRDPRRDRLVAVRNQPGKPIDTWFLSWTRSPVDPDAEGRTTIWRIGPARLTAAGDGIEIPFLLSAATRVVGAVHDLEGKLVRRLDEAKLPAGSWTFVWDGRDESGASVPPGFYDVMLTRLDTGAVGKLRVAREK